MVFSGSRVHKFLFRDDREASSNQTLEQFRIAAVAEQGLVGGI